MSERVDNIESVGKSSAPARRLRVSILEMMMLVAALAVSFRWPGLTVPVALLFLYTLARRRDILRRQTRIALGQIALALYLPVAVAILRFPFEVWGEYVASFSLMPTFILGGLTQLLWVRHSGPQLPRAVMAAMQVVVQSLSLLAVFGTLGVVAKRGIVWRIPCLILASGMSALSTLFLWVMWYAEGI
jgi:hypothetical protein